MAVDALHRGGVLPVRKAHFAHARGMLGALHRHQRDARALDLGGGMAGSAGLRLERAAVEGLVMAEVAATRHGEDQLASGPTQRVTGDAGQRRVTRMGERIDWSGGNDRDGGRDRGPGGRSLLGRDGSLAARRPRLLDRCHFDITAIERIMPHRYPFLLVDRILLLEQRKRVVGIKNVTINEPFFVGHFPGHPIMPPVLILSLIHIS